MLMRAFSRVDDDGRIPVGRNLWRHCRMLDVTEAAYLLVGLKGSSRKEYLFIHRIGLVPRLSPFECVLAAGRCAIDRGGICLGDELLRDTCFTPNSRVAIKLAGTGTLHWLAVRWRGPAVASTLQKRMGVRRIAGTQTGKPGKWQRMPMEY